MTCKFYFLSGVYSTFHLLKYKKKENTYHGIRFYSLKFSIHSLNIVINIQINIQCSEIWYIWSCNQLLEYYYTMAEK